MQHRGANVQTYHMEQNSEPPQKVTGEECGCLRSVICTGRTGRSHLSNHTTGKVRKMLTDSPKKRSAFFVSNNNPN